MQIADLARDPDAGRRGPRAARRVPRRSCARRCRPAGSPAPGAVVARAHGAHPQRAASTRSRARRRRSRPAGAAAAAGSRGAPIVQALEVGPALQDLEAASSSDVGHSPAFPGWPPSPSCSRVVAVAPSARRAPAAGPRRTAARLRFLVREMPLEIALAHPPAGGIPALSGGAGCDDDVGRDADLLDRATGRACSRAPSSAAGPTRPRAG